MQIMANITTLTSNICCTTPFSYLSEMLITIININLILVINFKLAQLLKSLLLQQFINYDYDYCYYSVIVTKINVLQMMNTN